MTPEHDALIEKMADAIREAMDSSGMPNSRGAVAALSVVMDAVLRIVREPGQSYTYYTCDMDSPAMEECTGHLPKTAAEIEADLLKLAGRKE